jgi:hypothetical protein
MAPARRLPPPGLAALAAFALAGSACGGAHDGEPVGTSSSAITPTYGCDYSFARPSPASIIAQGFTFAARYVSGGGGKDLTAGEANELSAAGLDIVVVWEASGTAALNGYAQGASDARAAAAEAASCGEPDDRPIYFAVDFEAEPSDIGAVSSYFDGVASVLGVARTGAYGGLYTVQQLFDAGKITFGWQTYAWSDGQWDSRAQLRQIQNGIDGDEEDEDEGVAQDFGQWGAHAAAPPPPSPARGSLDSVTCDQIAGWAEDPNAPSTASPVDIYLDGPAGTGRGLGRFTAGNMRSDLCSAIGSCDHGFAIQPPATLYDGHSHSVYAYAIAVTPGASNTLLSNAPLTLHCAATITGDFAGSGDTEVAQFRDDWQTIPRCGRFGSDWSCDNPAATYVGGAFGAGNSGTAVYPGGTPLVGDVNGDGKDDVIQWNGAWQSLPVCFSTGSAWSCENLAADYVGGLGAGNSASGVYAGQTALVADVNGDGKADVVQWDPSWESLPVCFSTGRGWSCENLRASYVGGRGAGNAGSGVYADTSGTTHVTVLTADVDGDGKADVIEYDPSWTTIPVCFSTGRGWACENLAADYVGGIGQGNGGSGVYGATSVFTADVDGDGRADVVQYNPAWASIPVCFSTARGWSCENLRADYIGGLGVGNAGTGVYGATTVVVADVNGDGRADVVEYNPAWQSIPVCFSTPRGWSCDNLAAHLGAGGTSAVYPFGVAVAGKFGGGKGSDILQIDPGSGWTSLPLCALDATGWACDSSAATVY